MWALPQMSLTEPTYGAASRLLRLHVLAGAPALLRPCGVRRRRGACLTLYCWAFLFLLNPLSAAPCDADYVHGRAHVFRLKADFFFDKNAGCRNRFGFIKERRVVINETLNRVEVSEEGVKTGTVSQAVVSPGHDIYGIVGLGMRLKYSKKKHRPLFVERGEHSLNDWLFLNPELIHTGSPCLIRVKMAAADCATTSSNLLTFSCKEPPAESAARNADVTAKPEPES